jgi:Fe-S oxidoreductase
MTPTHFNPGCALTLYKPHLAGRTLRLLNERLGPVALHEVCCHHDPRLPEGSVIVNVCPGCDRRFRSLYPGISTVSLWEVLDGLPGLLLPDYEGERMSVHDACPVRERPGVHYSVRSLLRKMNVEVVEADNTGARSICCGDDFYGKLPLDEVHRQMRLRAEGMPCRDVCVTCVSCVKSMAIGGKTPRHLIDLIFGEATGPEDPDTVRWHQRVDAYIEAH